MSLVCSGRRDYGSGTVQPLLLLTLFFAICTSAQQAPKAANAEVEIRALETVRLKSFSKTELWSGNVAKGALFHLGNGTVGSKQDLLPHMHQLVVEDSLEMSDTMFRQFGDVAVFSYVFTRTDLNDATAVTRQHIRRTLVYQRTGSGWQMIASAVAIIPFADLQAKPVDPKILDTYVGVWASAPSAPKVTLTREGGKLMAQESNENEKTELLAVSDTTFVIRGDSLLITFEQGTDGKVTRMLFHDIGGSVQSFERSVTDKK